MIKLYHMPGTRSVRIIWLLEEMGTPYELITLDRAAEEHKKPAYLKIHPLGSVPALDDNGTTLFESGAILEYLGETHGAAPLVPGPGSATRAHYLQWLHFAEATAMPPLIAYAMASGMFGGSEPDETAMAAAKERMHGVLAVLEDVLSGHDYLLDSGFSAADIMLGYGLITLGRMGMLEGFDKLQAYTARLSERPAYQQTSAV